MGSLENSGVHDLPVFRAISLWHTCKRPCTFWLPDGVVIPAVQRKIHPACPNRGVLDALPRACLQNSPHVPPARNRRRPDVPRSGGGSGGHSATCRLRQPAGIWVPRLNSDGIMLSQLSRGVLLRVGRGRSKSGTLTAVTSSSLQAVVLWRKWLASQRLQNG